jgi:hypothetical protein
MAEILLELLELGSERFASIMVSSNRQEKDFRYEV